MSAARLRPSRRFAAGGRVKTYDFSPGRLERLHLSVWSVPKAGGLIRAKLTGQAYVACGEGNEHYPEIEIECAGHPSNADSGTLIGALGGNEESATELAEELEGFALEDWVDPCEGFDFDDDDEEES